MSGPPILTHRIPPSEREDVTGVITALVPNRRNMEVPRRSALGQAGLESARTDQPPPVGSYEYANERGELSTTVGNTAIVSDPDDVVVRFNLARDWKVRDGKYVPSGNCIGCCDEHEID